MHPRQRQRGYRPGAEPAPRRAAVSGALLWRLAGVAVALDDAYVPVGRFEEIDARRLRQYGNSLYTLLERRDGVRVRLGAIQARATLPDRETMTLLGLSDVEPLLMITRLGQALTGEVVEWRERLCRSARWAFQREP